MNDAPSTSAQGDQSPAVDKAVDPPRPCSADPCAPAPSDAQHPSAAAAVMPEAKPRRHKGHRHYVRHPKFPHMPASVPLTYTLTMKACLSTGPQDRPSFTAVLTLLDYMAAEVASGRYMNTHGHWQVRRPLLASCHYMTLGACSDAVIVVHPNARQRRIAMVRPTVFDDPAHVCRVFAFVKNVSTNDVAGWLSSRRYQHRRKPA